jgi:transposase-like protein
MEQRGNQGSPRRRRRGRCPKEFRKDVAALVIDQRRTIADVACQLGVVEQRLGNWVLRAWIAVSDRDLP